MMKKVVRFALGGILAAVLVGIVIFSFLPQPVLVDLATIESGPLQVTVDEDGVTRIKDRYAVSTPLSGRLDRITLKVGDQVYKDETIIASMQPTDPSLLDPRAIAQAKARVNAAERRVAARQADLKKAESEVAFSEREMGRVRKLKEQNAASVSELESKELAFRSKTESARAAGFAVDMAEYELELEKAALLRTDPDAKQTETDQMVLLVKAPIDGRVLRLYHESSAVLAAGAAIMELGDPVDLEIVTDVLSYDAVKVLPGAKVELVNWGGEKPLACEVRTVEPSGFTKLSALGVEEQRVNVIIDLIDPAEDRKTLGDGFRVDSRIVVWESENALKVPTNAMFRVQGDWNVFTIQEGKAVLTRVEIGVNNGIEAEVLSGLSIGDQVVVHPSDAVTDGVLVQDRESV